jgi:hypothetical protein
MIVASRNLLMATITTYGIHSFTCKKSHLLTTLRNQSKDAFEIYSNIKSAQRILIFAVH